MIRQGRGKVNGVIRIITGTKKQDGLDIEVAMIVYYYLLANGNISALEVLRYWFYLGNKIKGDGRKRLRRLQNRYPCINNDLILEAENIVNAHREWSTSIPVVSTPLIFFKDILLPQNFYISDLTYYIFNYI